MISAPKMRSNGVSNTGSWVVSELNVDQSSARIKIRTEVEGKDDDDSDGKLELTFLSRFARTDG